MGRKTKLFLRILLLVALALLTMGASECAPEAAPIEKGVPVLRNDLAGGDLEIKNNIPGENFVFVTRYSTDYDTTRWRITDFKTIRMEAWIDIVDPNQDAPQVFVEHVHIDCSIQSRLAGVDGLPQDSMDDKLHTGDQVGFWITEEYPYENVFIIEGYSKTLIDGWGFVSGGTGVMTLEEDRLTEKTLIEKGKAYASKISIVYDLMIKYPNENYFHTRSIVNEFLVPVAGAILD